MTKGLRAIAGEAFPAVSRLLMLAAVVFLAAAQARGDEHRIIAADEASRRAEVGQVLIVDVRSPAEWGHTGVARGAARVTIHDPAGMRGFIQAMKQVVDGDLDRPVALICAQGVRSTVAERALVGAGFTGVLNIKEGMFGSSAGPGWLARGLPVEK